MTQEQKDLLLRDLCGRLPYGVKIHFSGWDSEYLKRKEMVDILYTIDSDGYCNTNEYDSLLELGNIKPYLFPISSMTKEQNLEYLSTCKGSNACVPTLASFEWCNKNHFDYRGLIPIGLAIDATGLNIY